MQQPPKIRHKTLAAQSRLFSVESVELEFSNGETRTFERINAHGHGAVMVVPVDGDELLLVREYALGREAYELGFVKGLIDPGETPEQAANRELAEEIGFVANELVRLRSVNTAPHYNTLQSDLFVARGLRPKKLDGDEPEPLEVERWPLAQIPALLEHPDITDARTLFALAYLQLQTPD